MNRLVKDGKIVLDGTEPKYVKEKMAFEKLEKIEDIEEDLEIEDLSNPVRVCLHVWYEGEEYIVFHYKKKDKINEQIKQQIKEQNNEHN